MHDLLDQELQTREDSSPKTFAPEKVYIVQKIGHHKLFTSEEEQAAARTLKILEKTRWAEVLGYRPIYLPISDVIEQALIKNNIETVSSISNSLDLLRIKKRFRLVHVEQAVNTLFKADIDRQLIDKVEDEISNRLLFTMPPKDSELLSNITINKYSITIKRYKFLDDYIKAIQEARKNTLRARNSFLTFNIRLVLYIARKYRFAGMEFEDLVQEGVFGLMKAVNRYEPSRGTKFSTFATWWIRHTIGRAIADKGRTIRVPVHRSDLYQRIRRKELDLFGEKEGVPSDQELADSLDIPVKLIKEYRSVSVSTVSLSRPVSPHNDEIVLGDILEDTGCPTPDGALQEEQRKKLLFEALKILSPREQKILKLRHGIESINSRTLEEIGSIYNLTRERIRQIESEAHRKLQDHFSSTGTEFDF